ncbi:UNVERIFIED_CONTAM: hypothetical protein FKN15_052861 [Acipenser sinensis]
MASTPEENDRNSKLRSVSVDLNNDASLMIDIPDALCERDKVKFTVHTKTTLDAFQKPEFSVPRQHEDFIWLHDTLDETEEYAGLIIPPSPPKPDFESPREKMHKLGEGEATMTKEEYTKMKQELEAEYLAVFKKTVQVHEVFLQRLSSHPVLSKDRNFQIFLEYDQDLSVRRKNAKEMFGGFFKNMVKTADEVIISGVKEVDDFFDQEKTFLLDYYNKIRDATTKAEKMTRAHKNVADDYIHFSATLDSLSADESTALKIIYGQRFTFFEVDDFFDQEKTFLLDYFNKIRDATTKAEKMTRAHKNVADDYIHFSATLDSLSADESTALKMYNKIRDATTKAEKMTRAHKNVADDYIHFSATLDSLSADESTALKMYLLKLAELFEKLRKVEGRVASDEDLKLTELLRYYMRDIQAAKLQYVHFDIAELISFKGRRVVAFRKNLIEMAELEIKHAKLQYVHFDIAELISFKGRRVVAFRKNLIEMAELEIKHAKLQYVHFDIAELISFKGRRVVAFRKNLIEMAELEIKHAKSSVSLLQSCIDMLKTN